jgi:predicted Rossmann fold nucleotide-binding protein DprA/Smf involved in DNA uptake
MQTSLLPETGDRPERIVSGGQTGVDRAALDVALEFGLPCGGWCPKGRKAEDGTLASRYPLTETPSDSYDQRTRWNVRDSDGTLILTEGEPVGGTALTVEVARELGRPLLVLDLNQPADPGSIRNWLRFNRIQTLNIAGPRESQLPGIYRRARELLENLLDKQSLSGS